MGTQNQCLILTWIIGKEKSSKNFRVVISELRFENDKNFETETVERALLREMSVVGNVDTFPGLPNMDSTRMARVLCLHRPT